jgi:translation elongation factor EF-Tu-like GTPase
MVNKIDQFVSKWGVVKFLTALTVACSVFVALMVALGLTALVAMSQVPHEAQPGFTIQMSLVDFMIVQRALMALQDEKAPGVLDNIRKQISAQVAPR